MRHHSHKSAESAVVILINRKESLASSTSPPPLWKRQIEPTRHTEDLIVTLSLRLGIRIASFQRKHAAVSRADRGLSACSRRTRADCRGANAAERGYGATWRDRDLDVFRTARDHLLRQAFDVDPLRRVVVRCGDDFDDLVAGELQARNVRGRTCHQVAVQDTKDGLVRDDQEVILLALELENDRLETNGEVVIGLRTLAGYHD